MSSKQTVLDEIRRGISPEELAEKIPWEGLGKFELVELLKASHQGRSDQQSYQLLVYLFRISSQKDLWFSVEVLAEVIQHPIMTVKDRQSILWTMRSRLDRIRKEITAAAPSEENLRKYWLMEASYYVVNSTNLAKTGHQVEAIQNNQIAQGIFEQLGLSQQAARLKKGAPLSPDVSPTQPIPVAARPSAAAPSAPEVDPDPTRGKTPEPEPVGIAPNLDNASPGSPASVSPVKTQSQPSAAAPEAAAPIAPPIQEIPAAQVETQSLPSSAAPEAAAPESPPSLEISAASPVIYQPLPDVWLKEGQLYVQGSAAGQSVDASGQAEQILRQSEILAGIQLQIQMYLERRSRLDHEVKALEARAVSLKTLCARMEKKIKKSAGSQ